MKYQCALAHDLLNALTAIIAQCELLSECTVDGPTLRRTQSIKQAADRMAQALRSRSCDRSSSAERMV